MHSERKVCMNNEKYLNENIFENILTSAFYDYMTKQAEDEPTDEELYEKYHVPKNGLKRILKIAKEKKYHKPLYIVYLRRAAVTVLILAAAMFTAMMSRSEIRAAIADVITKWYNTHIRIEFTADPSDETVTTPISADSLQIGYIPDGFELTKSVVYDQLYISYLYQNTATDKYIDITISKTGITDYMLDIEHHNIESTVINGSAAYIHTPSDSNEPPHTAVILINQSYTLMIDARLSREEAIKIAENIRIGN